MSSRGVFQRLLVDSLVVWGDTMKLVTDQTASVMRRLNLGVGGLRLTPEGLDDLRHLAALQIRHLLEIPDSPGARPSAPPLPDPVAIARAMLELRSEDGNGEAGDDVLVDAVERQVRSHFSALLDPEQSDASGHHPALATIVTQLTPDEARILRYLHHLGAAPIVDVAAAPRVGRGGRTIAESLSVLTDRAGGDHPEQAPAQLANLARLGLVRLSRTELAGHGDYQLIEASAAFETVAADIREQGQRVRVVRRSARLTPLGRELCTLALGPSGVEPDDDDEAAPGTVVGTAARPDDPEGDR